MNWYKRAKLTNTLTKQSSMSLYVKGFDYPHRLNTILDLCFYLQHIIFKDIQTVLKPEEYEQWRTNGMGPEFFAPDGDDFDKPIGIINNYIKGFPPNKISWLLHNVLTALREVNVKVTDVRQESFPDSSEIRVIRYSVDLNPNANIKKDIPADINFSNSNAGLILKILGFEGDIWDGGNTLDPKTTYDEVIRLQDNSVLMARMKDIGMGTNIDMSSFISIQQRLKTVGEVAKWAVDHGYQEMYFA